MHTCQIMAIVIGVTLITAIAPSADAARLRSRRKQRCIANTVTQVASQSAVESSAPEFATPQVAFEAYRCAQIADDAGFLYRISSRKGQEQLLVGAVYMGGNIIALAEYGDSQLSHKTSTVMQRHGIGREMLDAAMQDYASAARVHRFSNAAFEQFSQRINSMPIQDSPGLVRELMSLVNRANLSFNRTRPDSQRELLQEAASKRAMAQSMQLTGLKIVHDRALMTISHDGGQFPMALRRVNGRWRFALSD